MTPEYLVSFGRAAHLGRFRASLPASYCRGDHVVIHGMRGIELGTVLGPARQSIPDPHVGEVLRIATLDDRSTANARQQTSQRLCIDAEAIARQLGLSLAVIDAEVALDGRGAVLHTLGDDNNVAGLLDELAERHGIIVRHYDLGLDNPLPADALDALDELKCDRPDCGERDCSNCGDDGGCNSCSAGGAKELESYFAELRAKMESDRRTPLA